MIRAPQHLIWGACAAWISLLCGCDDSAIQLNRTAPPPLSPQAARVVLSAQGLAQLTNTVTARRLVVRREAEGVVLEGQALAQLGPLDQPVPISSITAQPSTGLLRTIVGLGQPVITIPLRLGKGADTRICRWRVALTSAALETRTVLDAPAPDQPVRLVPERPATVSWVSAQVTPLGACALSTAAEQQLRAALVTYTRAAIIEAAATLATLEPAAALGLPDGAIELTRISAFESRRGQLVVGVAASATPARLAADGLHLDLDLGAIAKPAACAPPADAAPKPAIQATQPDDKEMRQRRADAAIVLTLPALERLTQNLLRAGFGCRGLEDMSDLSATAHPVSRRDLRLEDVGVATSLVGEQLGAVISLGDVPRMSTRPADNLLIVELSRLTIDLYGQVAGATLLIASLQADVTLELEPGGRGDRSMVLRINNALALSPVLSSEWRTGAVDGEALTTWARRLVLLLWGEALVVPAPLLPDSPLHMIGAQVRAQDLVLYGRL